MYLFVSIYINKTESLDELLRPFINDIIKQIARASAVNKQF